MSRLKPHLQTPATWISLLALFVALGGTAYAAVTITGKQVVNSSLTGADIKNGSIDLADLSTKTKASLAGAKGATGATGAPGAAGTPGANGTNGAAGTNGTNGANGTDGSAVAYGGVFGTNASGGSCTVDTARSFHVLTACTRASDGVYTVGISSVPSPFDVTIDLDSRVGTCSLRSPAVGYCSLRFPTPTTAEVTTRNPAGTPTDFGTGAWFAIY